MATIKLNKEDLEVLFDNIDIETEVANAILDNSGNDFWSDRLLEAMTTNKQDLQDIITRAVQDYLNEFLHVLVQNAITEEVETAIRETIENRLDVLLAKK